MTYVLDNLSLFVVICTAREGFWFCNKVIIVYRKSVVGWENLLKSRSYE